MAAKCKRRAQPQTLTLEPLEDRLLLSLASVKSILPRPEDSNRAAVGAATIPQPTTLQTDERNGTASSRSPDWSLADRWIDRTDAGHLDKRDEAPEDLREHFANEIARRARAEAEMVRILAEQPVIAASDSLHPSQSQIGLGSSYQLASPNGPVPVAPDVPAFAPHNVSGMSPPWETAFAPLPSILNEESALRDDSSSIEKEDSTPTLLAAADNTNSIPSESLPLLDELGFSMPEIRQAVEAFLARLKELGIPPSFSWSSLSFGVWLAAVLSAAVETARRMQSVGGRRAPLLSANGWTRDA
jgi:hypothetical protein